MPEIAFYVNGEFPCSIYKHDSLGHLCGYIGVPTSHPWYGKDYDEVEADVHGGLTYFGSEKLHFRPSRERSDYLREHSLAKDWDDEEYSRLPRWDIEERAEAFPHNTGLDVWWLGFDCAHLGDSVPGVSENGVLRDEAFVRTELESLTTQAAAVVGSEQGG